MAIERYTVFFNLQSHGTPSLANWAEGTVKVKAGAKNKGLVASDTEPSRHLSPTALINNKPVHCECVSLEAESRAEAAECVRAFYGQSVVTNVCLSVLSSNLEEAKMQV